MKDKTPTIKYLFSERSQLFSITISDRDEDPKKDTSLDDFPILQEFANVFPLELLGMPPPRAVDFHIDLVSRLEPISRASTNVTEVRSFMGLLGYYRCFGLRFCRLAHPITSL